MFATGYPSLIIIRVKNNTKEILDNLVFYYENGSKKTEIKIKKIKPNKEVQTGISSIYANGNELKLNLYSKDSLIYEKVERDDKKLLVININSVDELKNLEFEVKEKEM
ncbi:MAG: hypothetical protein ACRC1T_13830 [Clostridium chrysemydis]|uniref:hypothetical protein n=1 Tax=Clostridium chrysemydis TaxID=2665504 RepID=UPI003F330632